eukprot:CAMPEP_0174260574 /NCGR_PEP_ID=MMETSP0439-20130205/9957_1 /TAXON_ID=0 /ORGANISM="Stereomyxa ramosa, Strain Chinc5" /LENGTH=408 /DNA_ID=CAMNT_0015344841 /DNA_START=15 /DNA_END=1241 /DNA_ORIENTATION=+
MKAAAVVLIVVICLVGRTKGMLEKEQHILEAQRLAAEDCVPLFEFSFQGDCELLLNIWSGTYYNCSPFDLSLQCVAVSTPNGCIVSVQDGEILNQVQNLGQQVYLIFPAELGVTFEGCVVRDCTGEYIPCLLKGVDFETQTEYCSGACYKTACSVVSQKGNILQIGDSEGEELCECVCEDGNPCQFQLVEDPCTEVLLVDYFDNNNLTSNPDVGGGFELGPFFPPSATSFVVEENGVVEITGTATGRTAQSIALFDPIGTTLVWRIDERPVGTTGSGVNGVEVGWVEDGGVLGKTEYVHVVVEVRDDRIVFDIDPDALPFNTQDRLVEQLGDFSFLTTDFCVSIFLGEDSWEVRVYKTGEIDFVQSGGYNPGRDIGTIVANSGGSMKVQAMSLREGAVSTLDSVRLSV